MRINGTVWSARDIAARIDHTVLAPDATRKDMENACVLARAYGFKAVFTNPYWTPLVAELLDGSGIAAGISAAFPLGSLSTDAKVAEVMDAVARVDGKPCAVDMVTNIALLKEGHFDDYTHGISPQWSTRWKGGVSSSRRSSKRRSSTRRKSARLAAVPPKRAWTL